MNLDPAPRLPKWIFIVVDLGLLLTAFLIVTFSKNPYAPLPFVSAVLCAVLAAIVGLIPFLIDYAADSAEYVQRERERVGEQVQRLQAATESLARAAAQIKSVEEAVHKTAHAAENLPYRMQEKLAEFNEALAEKEDAEREALENELEELRAANSERLKATAEKIQKAATEWSAVEASTRKHLSASQEAVARLEERLKHTLGEIDARAASLVRPPALAPAPAPAAVPAPAPSRSSNTAAPFGVSAPAATPVEPPPAPPAPPAAEPPEASSPTVIESISLTHSSAPPLEEPKPRKPRAPRKPKPEETLAAMSEPAAQAPAEESVTTAEPMEAAAVPAEASVTSDGATRLLATAYIGIGNKLFIRGDGPGLSWDKGIPMQFVSIGKWGWASHDATAPVRCKLYKNDEIAALSGEIQLEPGKHVEVTALF